MTTAHRPTWKAAYGLSDSVGKGYVPTRSYSARDLPGYLKLKQRQWGQGSVDQLKQKDFKKQLLRREAQIKRKKQGGGDIQIIQDQIAPGKRNRQQQVDFISVQPQKSKKIHKPSDNQNNQQHQLLQRNNQQYEQNPFPQDEDSQQFIKQQPQHQKQKKKRINSQDDEDSQQEDDEDQQQLMRQYQKIKQQREKQQLHKRQQKHKQSMANKQAQLLKGNPLIDSSYSMSKRWYEDTVFRNQAKKIQDKKTFVNDYVRSDFHRKFMNRYVMR